ncbi:MAG: UTP--glucose-1-phosphate uridylyltransferase, partial [Zymomonas sp.]
LGTQAKGAGNEIQLTDAMLRLSENQKFFARPYAGKTFDCGAKDGFIQANVAFALARDDIRELVYEPISEMVKSYSGRVTVA